MEAKSPDVLKTSAPSRYEIVSKVATGGMATVFVGRIRGASGFSRIVAIKKPHPHVMADPEQATQIEQEAKLASMIHHPNVVSVLDVDQSDGELCLILEYIEGCTFSKLCKDLPAEPIYDAIVLRVMLDCCAGLHAAHRAKDLSGQILGIVHRDISPHNILVGLDGIGRITDFGIAKAAASGDRTATSVLKGKIAYMPPEYLESRRFDARSDLFALAVVGWQALTRRRLFKGATELETMKMVVGAPIPLVGDIRPELAPLNDVFARALSRDPELRYPSVEAFGADLESTAREMDRLASTSDVGELVEGVARDSLAIRHSSLVGERNSGKPSRDSMPTQSLLAPVSVATTKDDRQSLRNDEPLTTVKIPHARRIPRVVALVAIPILTFAIFALVFVIRLGQGRPARDREASSGSSLPTAQTIEREEQMSRDLRSQHSVPISATNSVSAAPVVSAEIASSAKRKTKVLPRPKTPPLVPTLAPPNPYDKK